MKSNQLQIFVRIKFPIGFPIDFDFIMSFGTYDFVSYEDRICHNFINELLYVFWLKSGFIIRTVEYRIALFFQNLESGTFIRFWYYC